VLAPSLLGQDVPQREPGLLDAIQTLTREAREIIARKAEPRREANFASDFEGTIEPEKLVRRILRPVDRDPFIDAYVRWQLTSFDPPLDSLPDRQYEALLRSLPALEENPRAEESLLATLRQFAEAGALDEPRRRAVQEEIDAAKELAEHAELRNEPALHLRAWIERKWPECSLRAIEVQIERCDALIKAGWPVDRAKQDLERCLARAASERSVDDDGRRRLARLLPPLTRTSRLYLADAFFAGEALTLDLADTAIYDFDVRRWLRLLEGSP
jgi:hypothetical protein